MYKNNKSIEETFNSAFKNHQKNNLQVAENLYEEILKIDPNHFQTICFLGTLSIQIKNFDRAKQLFNEAIKIQPNNANVHNNLGTVFKELEDFKKSVNYFQKVIEIQPNHADAHNNLGVVFDELGEYQKAINSYQNAIRFDSDNANVHNNLGVVFKELGEYQKAINSYQNAIRFDPNNVSAYHNLGVVFEELGDYQKAINYYKKAITIKPNFAKAHNSLGIVLLLLSDFQKGFEEYEWRKKISEKKYYKKKDIESSEWNGEDLKGKTILILSEQGYGDIIQFARYIYMLENKFFVNVIFRTRKKLMHLFPSSKFKIISDEDPIPQHDFHIYLLSIPKIFYKETKTIPKQINYISKNTKIAFKWNKKLSQIKGIKIGINWHGSKSHKFYRSRSIPLIFFEELFSIKKINFINLQKGPGLEQIKKFKYKDKFHDFSSEVDNGENAFEDTIGILQNLDLVISADTSLVQLSATLGIETWVLLQFSPHWAWFLSSNRSPWHEHIKIYRQDKINNWGSVFSLVKKDLINKYT